MTDQTLRILGTRVTLLDAVQELARQDLDFDIEFDVRGSLAVQQKGILQPNDYDISDQWFHSIDLLWTAGSIQPIQTEQIALWDEIGGLTKTGRLTSGSKLGAGNRPMDVQFVQEDGLLGSSSMTQISAVPTAFNADSFSYDPSHLPSTLDIGAESWGWLLSDEWRGKVGLFTDPSIGIVDMILAAQATSLIQFEDIGNLSIEEIDTLVDELVLFKKAGHFAGTWPSVAGSVEFMQKRKGQIGGIWSPAASMLRAQEFPIRIAAPVEGYRAWHSCLCLSSHLPPEKAVIAYQYLNWWLSGRPGAILARQGYYSSTPTKAKLHMSDEEWKYWYAGKPAEEDLKDPQGRIIIRKGTSREGGSLQDRISNIVVWNTLMDEQNYLVRRWNEFLAA